MGVREWIDFDLTWLNGGECESSYIPPNSLPQMENEGN